GASDSFGFTGPTISASCAQGAVEKVTPSLSAGYVALATLWGWPGPSVLFAASRKKRVHCVSGRGHAVLRAILFTVSPGARISTSTDGSFSQPLSMALR